MGLKSEYWRFFLLLFSLLVSINNGFSQNVEEEIEPIIKEPSVPRILIDWESFGINEAKSNGFELLTVKPNACDLETDFSGSRFEELPTIKGFDYKFKNDSLIVNYIVEANCCSNFVCSIDHKKLIEPKKELIVELHDFGSTCECNCCFNICYIIKVKKDVFPKDYKIMPSLNGEIIEFE